MVLFAAPAHFPAHFHKIKKIDHNSKYRCAGCRQTGHRKACVRLNAHKPGHGQAHEKSLGNFLFRQKEPGMYRYILCSSHCPYIDILTPHRDTPF